MKLDTAAPKEDRPLSNISLSNANIQIDENIDIREGAPIESNKVNLHYNKMERTGSRFSKGILSDNASELGDQSNPVKYAPV